MDQNNSIIDSELNRDSSIQSMTDSDHLNKSMKDLSQTRTINVSEKSTLMDPIKDALKSHSLRNGLDSELNADCQGLVTT